MIASESNRPPAAGQPTSDGDGPDQPVTTLRGATVDVDLRWIARVVVAILLVTLVVLAIVLLVVGLHTNSQIDRLRHDGVPVSVTVTHCTGLIGGTGSQTAGYSCTGTYTVDGTRYLQAIPGTTVFHALGSTFEGVVVPGDPRLLSTPAQVEAQHASARVFTLPGVLVLVAVVWGSALLVRRRRRRRPPRAAGTTAGTER